jgi:Flp pilus assembly protein TadG
MVLIHVNDQRGNVTVLTASIACMMLGLIPGLAGIGSFLTARAQAQTAADAAALAAVQELLADGDARQAASDYAALNRGCVNDISIGEDYVLVSAEVDVSLPFLRAISVIPKSVQARGKAELREGIDDVL